VESYVAERPFEEDERGFVPLFVPPWASICAGGVLRSREGRGRWRLEIRSRRMRRWVVGAALATLRRPFRPCTVDATGGRLVRWRYDRRTRVLRVVLSAHRGGLAARACARMR
jgi:hypothetical protein